MNYTFSSVSPDVFGACQADLEAVLAFQENCDSETCAEIAFFLRVSKHSKSPHVLGTDKRRWALVYFLHLIPCSLSKWQKSEKQGTRTLNLGFTKLRERSLGEPRATIAPTSITHTISDDGNQQDKKQWFCWGVAALRINKP